MSNFKPVEASRHDEITGYVNLSAMGEVLKEVEGHIKSKTSTPKAHVGRNKAGDSEDEKVDELLHRSQQRKEQNTPGVDFI